MAEETITVSDGLTDLFAECDSCGCRILERVHTEPTGEMTELVCTACGMAYVTASPCLEDAAAVAGEAARAA